MPLWGWRPLFWGLAGLLLLSMLVIVWQVPAWTSHSKAPGAAKDSYAEVWRHPYFRKMIPIGFFNYGGMVAIQTLWAVPWMIKVGGSTPVQAATGLFWLNVAMLFTFWTWGLLNPGLARRGWRTDRLMAWGVPWSLVLLAVLVLGGDALVSWTGIFLALFCVSCTFVSLAQPAVGMAFAPELAGRALSAYNLVIFAGVFAMQWGIGLLIDGFQAAGLKEVQAFQAALGVFLLCSLGAYVYFLAAKSHHNEASQAS
jgi:predicted MFS family arabinose efflux permease